MPLPLPLGAVAVLVPQAASSDCVHGAQHTGILFAGPSDAAEHQIINTLSQAHSLFPSQPLLCE